MMNIVVRILCFLLPVLVVQCTFNRDPLYNGTSPGLKEIIIGRCHEFQQLSYLNRIKEFSVSVNCTTLWNEFNKSFAYKDICDVKKKDYDGFFTLINDTGRSERILFWTGTAVFSHDFSFVDDNFVTLEDTFPGYVANKLTWCGCEKGSKNCPTGIDYKNCNKSCAGWEYWARASTNLARKATGIGHVIVNGSHIGRDTAYYRWNFFGEDELPYLGSLKQIKKLVVLVALDLDRTPKETCGSVNSSLIELIADAKEYGIPEVQCIDNPVEVLGILCVKYPNAEQCKKKPTYNNYNYYYDKKSTGVEPITVIFIVLWVAFLVITIGLIIVIIRQRK